MSDIENNNLTYDLEKKKKPEEVGCLKTCCAFTGISFLVVILLGLIASVISYYVFGIKFLIEDKSINDQCESNIWSYVLASIITSFILGSVQTRKAASDEEPNVCSTFILGLGWLILGIFGIVYCHNENCNDLKNANLYLFAFVISIIQTTIGGITTLFFSILAIKSFCKN